MDKLKEVIKRECRIIEKCLSSTPAYKEGKVDFSINSGDDYIDVKYYKEGIFTNGIIYKFYEKDGKYCTAPQFYSQEYALDEQNWEGK